MPDTDPLIVAVTKDDHRHLHGMAPLPLGSMHKVFKYELRVIPRQIIMMPDGAAPLSVVVQGGIPYLYAQVNPHYKLKPHIIRTVCAGEEFDADNLLFIGTFIIGEWFAGHVFEEFEGKGSPVSSRYADDFVEAQKTVDARSRELAVA